MSQDVWRCVKILIIVRYWRFQVCQALLYEILFICWYHCFQVCNNTEESCHSVTSHIFKHHLIKLLPCVLLYTSSVDTIVKFVCMNDHFDLIRYFFIKGVFCAFYSVLFRNKYLWNKTQKIYLIKTHREAISVFTKWQYDHWKFGLNEHRFKTGEGNGFPRSVGAHRHASEVKPCI